MEHVVFFSGPDGVPQYRRTPSLQEAVRVVEHLCNADGVEDARVFSLTEVPLAVKAVYRVELQAPEAGAPAPFPPMPPLPPMPDFAVPAPDPAPAVEPVVAEVPAPAPAEPEPVAERPEPSEADADVPAPEPALAAVPSEPYEPAAEEPSNGKPTARGLGFFAR